LDRPAQADCSDGTLVAAVGFNFLAPYYSTPEQRTTMTPVEHLKAIPITSGIVAGFVATVVLSAVMLMKHSMGLMPELDPIAMITAATGATSPAIGWIAHFVIGSIFWGIGFAIVSPYLPGPYWLRGAIFAVGAWLVMMIVMMPMAGAGVFGLGLSMMTPMATLVMHVVFGLVLGGVYGLLGARQGVAPSYSR
jgi:hypothetical protein